MLFFKTNFNAIKTGLNNENVDVLGGWGCSKYVTCAGCGTACIVRPSVFRPSIPRNRPYSDQGIDIYTFPDQGIRIRLPRPVVAMAMEMAMAMLTTMLAAYGDGDGHDHGSGDGHGLGNAYDDAYCLLLCFSFSCICGWHLNSG